METDSVLCEDPVTSCTDESMSSDVRDISMSDDQTEFSSLVSNSGNVSSNTTMSSPELVCVNFIFVETVS